MTNLISALEENPVYVSEWLIRLNVPNSIAFDTLVRKHNCVIVTDKLIFVPPNSTIFSNLSNVAVYYDTE